jgi:hypothetical protein
MDLSARCGRHATGAFLQPTTLAKLGFAIMQSGVVATTARGDMLHNPL